MKSTTIVGTALILGAAGIGAYFLWPRKVKAAPVSSGKGTATNPIDRLNETLTGANKAVQQGSALFNQILSLGGKISDVVSGGDAGKNTTQSLEGNPPASKSTQAGGGPGIYAA